MIPIVDGVDNVDIRVDIRAEIRAEIGETILAVLPTFSEITGYFPPSRPHATVSVNGAGFTFAAHYLPDIVPLSIIYS